jgi:hypothetical protein
MTAEEDQQRIERETLERAIAVIQQYQNDNYRRARVNTICSEIKYLLTQELIGKTDHNSLRKGRQSYLHAK